MHTALWVAQGVLAFAMLGAGAMKLAVARVKLAEKQRWAASFSDGSVKLIGAAEVLGAVGLVVPMLTGIAPILTPIAACALLVLMVGAVKTHVDLKEPPYPPAVLGAIAGFIALGRFGVL